MTVSLKTDLRFPISGQQGHRRQNIHEKQFHYWKRQIRMNTAVQETVFAEYTGGTNMQGTGNIRNQPVLYIQGIKLYVPDNFNPDTLLSLVRILKQV